MAHPREEVEAAVATYVELRRRIDEGDLDSFGVLADLFTDDAVMVDASWGRLDGRPAIDNWLVDSMVGLLDWHFPIEFTAIEGDHVIIKWTQILPTPKPDGSPATQSAYSHLIYAGGGKFRYEEDMYNMAHVLADIEETGWVPTEPMNIPPANPDRDWSPEPRR